MFSEKPPGVTQPAYYAALKTSKTVIIQDDEHDVFGDGAVIIKSAPGHTPGHQVLYLTLPRTGGVVLSGSDHRPAQFAGMGLFNQRVRIRLGSNTIQLTGPGAPMTVSQWEIGSSPTTQFLTTGWRTFRLGSSTGIYNFPLGARVNVNANQAPYLPGQEPRAAAWRDLTPEEIKYIQAGTRVAPKPSQPGVPKPAGPPSQQKTTSGPDQIDGRTGKPRRR